MFETPILFLIYNRLDQTKESFESIKKIKPKHLFISADGPKENDLLDLENCMSTRNYVLESIDWVCDLKTFFRDTNLGCGLCPASAITWFFDNVEEGIILEDDCLADLSFFYFAKELLFKYRDNEKIMIISGTNQIADQYIINESYTFTDNAGIWGWASWKRAWNNYNYNIPEWGNHQIRKQVYDYFHFKNDANVFINGLNLAYNNQLDCWDYQWGLYRIMNNGLGIVPKCNLISNIGFGSHATHTFDADHVLGNMPISEILFPLKHPLIVLPNQSYNVELYNCFNFRKKVNISFIKRLSKKLNSIIKYLSNGNKKY
jgi:hypothetical protein